MNENNWITPPFLLPTGQSNGGIFLAEVPLSKRLDLFQADKKKKKKSLHISLPWLCELDCERGRVGNKIALWQVWRLCCCPEKLHGSWGTEMDSYSSGQRKTNPISTTCLGPIFNPRGLILTSSNTKDCPTKARLTLLEVSPPRRNGFLLNGIFILC